MKRLLIAGIVLSSFAAQAYAEPATSSPSSPPKDAEMQIFLLVGQSNMAGRGKIETQDQTAHPRVWMLNQQDEWAPAVDPLHFDKPKAAGVGLGLTFGKTIADANPDVQIGLIPCAVGGTTIEQWKKGGKLYDEAIRRAKIAAQHGKVAGILWHQGESDSATAKLAVYPEKLTQLIADLRADIEVPDAPFILGQLGRFRDAKSAGNAAMNELLLKYPETHPNTACATSEGLESNGDNTHFDAASLREYGRRYAAAYQKLKDVPATTSPTKP